jgi:RHS repeat-associated protein
LENGRQVMPGQRNTDLSGIVNPPIHMNGRIYDPRLGRMLSPDPVTQAPENGQNYNRYSYAYNNPLKYTDPSGFVADAGCTFWCQTAVASAFATVGNFFGGNGCDRTCKERKTAHNWCKAQSACLAELRANTREKFRRRSAQVIMEATLTGQSYYFEGGRAYLGDNTTGTGAPVNVQPVPGQNDWITATFVAHYFIGGGKPVNLGDVGLGDEFEASAQVQGGILYVKNQIEISLRSGGDGSISGVYDLVNVGDGDLSNPLYSVGSSNLQYTTTCVQGTCTATFVTKDFFADPLSIEESWLGVPVEIPPGIPYEINYEFTEEFKF